MLLLLVDMIVLAQSVPLAASPHALLLRDEITALAQSIPVAASQHPAATG